MFTTKKTNICNSFKPMDQDGTNHKNVDTSCNGCTHFSSRNCGIHEMDSIEHTLDIFN